MTTFILPFVPSELLRIGLEDFLEIRKDTEHFKISMADWVAHYRSDSYCSICVAGAVMVKRLDALDKMEKFNEVIVGYQEISPYSIGEENEKQLLALNCLRQGALAEAYNILGISRPEDVGSSFYVVHYTDDPFKWEQGIRALIKYLEERGQ